MLYSRLLVSRAIQRRSTRQSAADPVSGERLQRELIEKEKKKQAKRASRIAGAAKCFGE